MEKKVQTEPPKTIAEAASIGLEQGMAHKQPGRELRAVIAHRVKAMRVEAKMTQEEMAEKINVNALTYRGYENCKSDFPLLMLIRVADVLGLSLDYIAGRTEVRQMNVASSEKSIEQRLEDLEKLVASMKE
jgi:transcriptional regulator with XRE-family HTH domain